MLHNIKKRQEGFTIIEVMIVLVIAAVILLIVFLAVPALQRNSRNTQRRNDVAKVGAAVNEWVANNNGATFVAGTGNANLQAVIDSVGTLGQYTLTPGTNFTVATGAQTAQNTIANIRVVTNAQCGTNGATVAGSSTRQMAIQYAVENAGSSTTGEASCQNI